MSCIKCGGTEEIIDYNEEINKDYFTDEYKKFVEVYLKCLKCGNKRYYCFQEDALI